MLADADGGKRAAPTRPRIALAASPTLGALLIALHVGAFAAIVPSSAPGPIRVVATALLLVSLLHMLSRHALRVQAASVRWLEVDTDGWTIERRDGRRFGPLRLARSRINGPLMELVLDAGRGRHHLLIARDALSVRHYARLRALLAADARCGPMT